MVLKDLRITASAALKVSYLIILVTTILYVKSVLDVNSFKATEKTIEKPAVKIKEASVSLTVENQQEIRNYTTKLTNTDSVENFLKELRDKQGLVYEKDLYTYGSEIISVFDKEANSGRKWAILTDGKDITNNIAGEYLVNGSVYLLKQVSI
jgi:hypothetical protein